MTGSLVTTFLVFVCAPLLIWWLRRAKVGFTSGMRVTSRTALTRNGVIAVVETDGRRFLVGATDHRIDLLTELAPQEGEPTEHTEEPTTALVPSSGTGPWTSPIDALRNMTVRKPTRPRSARAHHRP